MTCSNGATHIIWNGFFSFEIALLQAILANQDGYRREGATSAFAALEAFRREYLTTFLPLATDPVLRNAIKLSERQLGAFIVDFYTRFGMTPSTMERKIDGIDIKNVRNRCAHEGYEPTERETALILSEVWQEIYSCLTSQVRIAFTNRKREQVLAVHAETKEKGRLLPIYQLLGPFGKALDPFDPEFHSHTFTYLEYLEVIDMFPDPGMLRETRKVKTAVTSESTPD